MRLRGVAAKRTMHKSEFPSLGEFMMRFWTLLAALLVVAAGPAAAQPQQRDPFNGQFGVVQVTAAPTQAARQARLMGEALAALEPQRPGELDVYMITASLWGDPVFEREATQAETILREHFGDATRGHTILLSAGGQGERIYPAPTPENISAAIGQVGAVIDRNEDLVVIFLTSHGSPDGSIAIREHNHFGAAMRPTHLRDLLIAAGINNRVVIVSACFSGAFIAPLADTNTIVLTAAQHDRSSFGCQPQREWTFFGDALFSHNLRGDKPLLEAFEDAKTLIAQWEREQNLTPPSNPQQYVGQNAAALLRRAERNAR